MGNAEEEVRKCLKYNGNVPYNASPEDGNVGNMNGGKNGGGLGAKLKCPVSISRLRVEKIEGGLMVAGVVVAANCQIALPAFGFLFVLVGALMLALGALLCALTRRARRRERRVGFHCPLHGDFYPLSPAQGVKLLGKNVNGWTKIPCFRGKSANGPNGIHGANGIAVKFGSRIGPPQCPHSVLSSTRSSVSSSPISPCPTPMPFLVTSGSMSGMVQISAGANLSPDQTFGSIRSLSVTREVASFPLSRTPTPPPQHRQVASQQTDSEDTSAIQTSNNSPPCLDSTTKDITMTAISQQPRPEIHVLAPSHRNDSLDTTSTTSTILQTQQQPSSGPRKSVSIVLPDETLG